MGSLGVVEADPLTSVDMIEKHYGHVKPLQAHKELTARYKI